MPQKKNPKTAYGLVLERDDFYMDSENSPTDKFTEPKRQTLIINNYHHTPKRRQNALPIESAKYPQILTMGF